MVIHLLHILLCCILTELIKITHFYHFNAIWDICFNCPSLHFVSSIPDWSTTILFFRCWLRASISKSTPKCFKLFTLLWDYITIHPSVKARSIWSRLLFIDNWVRSPSKRYDVVFVNLYICLFMWSHIGTDPTWPPSAVMRKPFQSRRKREKYLNSWSINM